MAPWVKCTSLHGVPLYINLGVASTIQWDEEGKQTHVSFAGIDEGIVVLERPEDVLKGKES